MSEVNVYGQSIEYGTLQYLDVLDLLSSIGYRATFTQTGGMSAAIELAIDENKFALITDADGPLAWEREDHHGWAVGVYEYQDTSDAVTYESTTNSSVEALMGILPPAS
ncbi:hypothetical protein [Rhodococcus erythropolis]|uniref:hypothetical protein n=1 Tax=Rhodococcus erythropolis TaxID=1833 RepID=UPI0008790CCA|nr:hypothetical protein [Rhodococcus erythropolis]OFV75138.1 hypothetical protein RERY_43040 [Rhodococcus erythropolis]